jgi:uncharacterized glyoxalase superfamily protein PhnB
VVNVKRIEAILTVPSVEDTIAWYEQVLEWSGHYDVHDEEGDCLFGSVFSNAGDFLGFHLSRYLGDKPYDRQHIDHAYMIHVDDVDAAYARAMEMKAEIDGPPQTQSWGGRSFSMVDINGYQLIFTMQVE